METKVTFKQEEVLKRIANDVADIKRKVENIEAGMEELDTKMHEVRPEYFERLKVIRKGKHHRFSSVDELRELVESAQS